MRKLILFTVCAALLSACGKQGVTIGRERPEEEVKKCLKLMDSKEYEDAIQCLEMFKSRFANTPLAQEAELKIGDTYYNKRDYLLAAESYIAFLRLYPTHPRADYARYMAGVSYLKESPKAIDRDQEYLGKAIEHLRFVVTRYSRGPYTDLAAKDLALAQQRMAKRQFYIGRFYYRTGEYLACIPRFSEVVEKYPSSGFTERSLYLMTVANLGLKRLEDARQSYSKLSLDFPSSKWTRKAERKLREAVK